MGLGGLWVEGISPGHSREGVHLAGVPGDLSELLYWTLLSMVFKNLKPLNLKIDNKTPQIMDPTKKPNPADLIF